MTTARANFSYHSYRQKILALADEGGFNVESYSPYSEYPNLKTFFVYNDALSSSDRVCVHLAGTHGVEGAAGAEVQLHLLSQHARILKESATGVLLVFAVNPFGFHFLRRTSIENIDLNRNTGDGLTAAPFEKSQEWLRPLWRSHGLLEQIRGLGQGLSLGLLRGLPWVIRAFAEGQTVEPEGLFYSGTQKAIEIQALVSALKPLLNDKNVLQVIDVHSGLGALYEQMLIHCAGSIDDSRRIFKRAIEVPGEKPNSYRGHGILADRWALEFPSAKLHFLVQEFGVKSTAHSFLALALENKYHWNNFKQMPDDLYLKHPTKDLLLETFFSPNPKWISWLRREGANRFLSFLSTNQDGVS